MGFSDIFGGGNIYPSEPTYNALNISANLTMQWPIEQAIEGTNVVADIMDITATVPGLSITLPDARQVSTGYTALFNNVGANTVSINNNAGSTLVSLVSGTVWQLYLVDNSTAAGTWRVFQFGASVSVAVAAALAGSGLKAIGSTLNERMLIVAHNANYVILNSDRATVQQWTSGVGQFTLPAPGTVGADWFVVAKNSGSGNLTIVPAAGLIDGNANLVLAPGSAAWFVTDGSNYFSLSAGAAGGGGAFNLLVIDVSGSGNFVLSGGQLNQIGYRFVGVLTGNRVIVVPNTTQEYWVDNETTGAFTLSVGTAAQVTPILVPQGNKNILYCDGTNVVSATSAAVTFPIAVSQGGTGATTAPVALTNLGGTSVGVSLFTAASVAAAQAAISAVPTSRNINTTAGILGGGSLAADLTLSLDPAFGVTIKPNDTSVSSSIVLSTDPDLQGIALVAGHTYEIDIRLNAGTTAGGGFAWSVNFSGGSWNPQNFMWLFQPTNAATFTIGSIATIATSFSDSITSTMIFQPLANGNLSIAWAQANSNATPTTLRKGSFIRVRQMN